MDIQLPLVNLLPSRPEIKGITGLLAQLTPGQQIDAVVESQIGDNYYLLRMSDSGLPLRARTPVALEAGRPLTLQVMESGDTPKLRIVTPQQAPVESADSQAIQQALREFLPKRLPAGQLAATLEQLLGAAAGEFAAKLPQPVRTAVAELARALPQSVRLANAEGLQQAVRDSGLFLEAKLATAAPGQARELAVADLKSRLLVLVDALRKQLEAEGGGDDAATEAMDLPEDYRPQPGSPAVAETGGRPLPRPSDQGATPLQNAGARPADTADASPERRLAVVSESALPPSARTESAAQPVPVERSSAQSTEPDGRPVAPAAENRPVARSLIQESAAVPPADAERPEFQASKQMAPDWAAAVVTPSPESGGHPLADAKLAPPASASQALPQAPGEFPAEPQVLAESAAQEPQPAPDAAKAGGSGAGKMPAEAGASPTGSRPDTPQPDGAKPQVLASLFKDLLGVDILSEPLVTATVTRAAEPGRDPASMPSQAGPTGEPESPQLQSPVQAEGGRPIPGTVTAGVDAQAFRAELKLLLHKAEGALAGIVTDQLASLPQVDGRQAVWQLEIPYQFGERADALLLKVVREGKRGAPPLQCFWSVTLELHPPGLGTVHARISLSAGNVDSYFWSDRAETSQAIRSHLDLLAARLQQAGLSVGRLDILPSAPAGLADGLPGAGSIVLDERA